MPTVTMTVEEYLALVKETENRSSPGQIVYKNSRTKPKRRSGKKDPKMAKALKKANSMMRTKSGKLRKGKTQGDIMRKAHQLRRKM